MLRGSSEGFPSSRRRFMKGGLFGLGVVAFPGFEKACLAFGHHRQRYTQPQYYPPVLPTGSFGTCGGTCPVARVGRAGMNLWYYYTKDCADTSGYYGGMTSPYDNLATGCSDTVGSAGPGCPDCVPSGFMTPSPQCPPFPPVPGKSLPAPAPHVHPTRRHVFANPRNADMPLPQNGIRLQGDDLDFTADTVATNPQLPPDLVLKHLDGHGKDFKIQLPPEIGWRVIRVFHLRVYRTSDQNPLDTGAQIAFGLQIDKDPASVKDKFDHIYYKVGHPATRYFCEGASFDLDAYFQILLANPALH